MSARGLSDRFTVASNVFHAVWCKLRTQKDVYYTYNIAQLVPIFFRTYSLANPVYFDLNLVFHLL